MAKLSGITLALLFAFIIIAVPMPGVKAQETLIWSANVPSTGQPITSPVLEAGIQYHIVATEMFWYNRPANLGADAYYYTTDPSDSWIWGNHFHWPAIPPYRSFLQIDGKDINWGPFSNGDTGHTYSIYLVGKGAAITFRIVDWIDHDYSNNDCHLPVRIYELPREPKCRTIGFWKTHPDEWPVSSLTIGDRTYNKDQLLGILRKANAKDATYMLAAQLIAAKLNDLSDAYTHPAILDADAFLITHPLGSNPRGLDRDYALMLKDALDYFNNGR